MHYRGRAELSSLTKKKATKDFEERLASLPKNTRENIQATINNFKKFVQEKHQSTADQICVKLIEIRKIDGDEEYQDALYNFLQEWIDWNILKKLGAYTIKTRFSILRKYLYFLGVKTNPQDIKQLLKFPRKHKEEKYPLKKQELRDLILAHARHPKRQALYLACSSSGMRLGEALQIKKSDLDFSLRVMIRIKAEYTKTKNARTTFVSKECQEKIKTYLQSLDDDDYVFTNSNGDLKTRGRTEQMALVNALKVLGYTEKYSSNGCYKITSHSFRSYFFTLATRRHDENYAHKMTGHGGYLMQYDRMTEEEKLEMYIELEPDLVVFDQSKNELKIEKLQKENMTINELQDEVKKLKEAQARQDKQILEGLVQNGNILKI